MKKIEFVREYEIQDGVAIPKHLESTADVRIVGRAELSIDFSNFTKQESADDDAGAQRADVQLDPIKGDPPLCR